MRIKFYSDRWPRVRNLLIAAIQPVKRFQSRAANGEERLWKVWWAAGIPVGWTASALVIIAEHLRYAEHHAWGDFFDVLRFLIYLVWFRLAWRCAHNVDHAVWTPLARATLLTGLVCMVTF